MRQLYHFFPRCLPPPRGSVQELGGKAIEADRCVLAAGASEQNRCTLCHSILRKMETMLEMYPLKFYTPASDA
jgi:hypothetical protein